VLGDPRHDALDGDLADRLVEYAAGLDALGLALEVDGHPGLDRLVQSHFLEIDVDDGVLHLVERELLDDGLMAALLAFELDVQHGVHAGGGAEGVTQHVRLHGDVRGRLAVPVEHARDEAGLAQPLGGAGPGGVAFVHDDADVFHAGVS